MRFSLVQMIMCVGLILIAAILFIRYFNPKPAKNILPEKPGVTVPFMNIKMK